MASLALEFVLAAVGPAGELLEVLLVGGQVLFEAVGRLSVTLAGPQPTEAADARTKGTFTWFALRLGQRAESQAQRWR